MATSYSLMPGEATEAKTEEKLSLTQSQQMENDELKRIITDFSPVSTRLKKYLVELKEPLTISLVQGELEELLQECKESQAFHAPKLAAGGNGIIVSTGLFSAAFACCICPVQSAILAWIYPTCTAAVGIGATAILLQQPASIASSNIASIKNTLKEIKNSEILKEIRESRFAALDTHSRFSRSSFVSLMRPVSPISPLSPDDSKDLQVNDAFIPSSPRR